MSSIEKVESMRTSALSRIAQTGLALARMHDPPAIASLAAEAILQLCGAQRVAFFYEIAYAAQPRYLLLALSQPGRGTVVRRLSAEEEASWPRLPGSEPLLSPDISYDPSFAAGNSHTRLPQDVLPLRSCIAIPLLDVEGRRAGGIVCGHSDPNVFADLAKELASTIAAQASVAMENIRLRHELTQRANHYEQARQALRESSDRLGELAAIVSSSNDAIISKDLNGIITSWNEAATRILGYAAHEIIGQPVLRLIPEHLHSDEAVILRKIRSGERVDHFETVRRTKKGELIDVSLTISPVRNEQGAIVGASKIMRDISASKRAERSLLQAEKIASAGRMAATIAHEINNPLEAVVNLLYLLRSSVQDADGAAYLKTAETELARVSHIARQTLGFYREYSSARPTSLAELVRHTISVYEPRCSAAGISITSSLHTSRQVVVRRGEIMQVVSNLLSNSIHAMPNGGSLTIDVHDVANGVVLSIRDTGCGVAQHDLPRVFEAFFTTRTSIGTGIGLFVSKQFIEGHGGSITIDSTQDELLHGTTVTVFLPETTPYDERSDEPLEP
ncbi:MAG TPA: PAS domain S-box protein [Edaphobacter sp.]|nr:PAS domain S-box protein [Edaphobacter sp.]